VQKGDFIRVLQGLCKTKASRENATRKRGAFQAKGATRRVLESRPHGSEGHSPTDSNLRGSSLARLAQPHVPVDEARTGVLGNASEALSSFATAAVAIGTAATGAAVATAVGGRDFLN
jgi:hypothetical protein